MAENIGDFFIFSAILGDLEGQNRGHGGENSDFLFFLCLFPCEDRSRSRFWRRILENISFSPPREYVSPSAGAILAEIFLFLAIFSAFRFLGLLRL